MASVAVKADNAANSAGTDVKGTAKAADLVFEDDDFEEFPGERMNEVGQGSLSWELTYHLMLSRLKSHKVLSAIL